MKKLLLICLITILFTSLFAQDAISVSDAKTAINTTQISNCANRGGAAQPIPCPPVPQIGSADSGGSSLIPNSNTSGLSVVENYSFNYIHSAWDWQPVNLIDSCGSCGGASGQQHFVPTIQLKRYHRFRDIHEQSSFGPGVFSNYDMNLQLSVSGAGSKIIFYDPEYYWRMQFEDGLYGDTKDGVFYEDLRPEEKARIVDKLTLFDAPLGTGNITSDLSLAKSAVVRNLHGRLAYFEIISVGSDLMGRLSRLEDRNGYGVNLTYKTFTLAEITASPTRQFQIDTVMDANGRIATFSYNPIQVSGKWVVSSIVMPNSQVVSYTYSGGYLTGIQHPDGSQSQFIFGIDGTTNTTTIQYKDVAAEGTHRTKTVYLTNNFNFGGSNYDTTYTSSSSLLVRMVINGANEVAYLNMFPGTTVVYEGGHQVKKFQTGAYLNYLQKGWTFNPTGTTLATMFPNGNFSHQGGQNIIGSIQQYYRNTPQEYITENGVIIRALYDAEGYITEKKRYYDGAYENYSYNQFKQKTRIRDMEGRVEKMTYDSRGNILTKEVGIKEIAGIDTNQPEYAIYQWEYYPSGHPNQFLQKAYIDANGNRTEYIYNAQQFLTQVIEAPDNLGDTQAILNYSYDSYGRLYSSSDAMGRTTIFEYDQRDRQTKVTYNDSSTERFFYGTSGSGNENLIVKKVDRNGNVTEFDFDPHGRKTKTTTGHLTMDFSGNQAAVTNPLTKVEEICTYLYGSNDDKTTCKRAGELTSYIFDGRNRWVSRTVQPNTATTLTTLRTYYSGSLLRDETDEYNRRTIYAYSWITSYLYRIIRETVPGNVFDYSQLYAIYGQNINNAPYVVTSYVTDLTGLNTQVTDPRGIKHTTTYDSRKRAIDNITAYNTSDAAKTVTIYDANSNIIEVQHPRNFDNTDPEFGKCRTTYSYTGRNLLKTKTEATGSTVQATESFTYTKDKREQTHTDFRGNLWTTIWHICCGRLEAKVDPLGNGTLYDVDYAGNVVHQISGSNFPLDPSQYVCNNQPVTALNETTTRFDERNRPTHTTQWLQPLGAITNKGRPALGNGQIPIAGEDGVPASQGLTTRFVYDDNLTDNIGLDLTYASNLIGLNLGNNADGSAVEVANPDGEKTLIIKDALGRTIKTVDGVGSETKMVYDTMVSGLLETSQIVDPSNLALTNKVQIDGINRAQKKIDAENQVSIVEYDNNKNAVKTRDANGVGLDCVFDNRNRDTSCTDTKGDKTTKTYDKNSNIIQTKDALNKTTTMVFDARNRLKSTTNRISGTVTQVYDNNSNLVTITDAQNNATQYFYDQRNLQTKRIFADSADASDNVVFTYDAVQRKTSQTDQAGVTISYNFDMANRLIQRSYPDNLNDVFQYDPASRLTQAVSNRYANTVTRSYNNDGTLATEGLSANSQNYQIAHFYDNAKRNYQTNYPNGKAVTKAFTARNQLSSIAYDNSIVANFTYDLGKRETIRGLGNGLTQITNYNLDNTIQQKSVAGITNFSYTYNANKQKLTETDSVNTSLSQTFAYDFENRLTSWLSNGTTLNQTQSWNLSLEGAWDTNTINGNTETRTFNAAYETLNSNKNSINSPLTHDRKGNLTQNKDGSLYSWDFDNQLSFSVSGTPSVNASYAYDALGRRVSKTSNNTTTLYVSTGYQIASEYKSINSNPFIEAQSYVYASYIDDPLVLLNSSGRYYYHGNAQFSVSKLTDSSQNIVESYAYNAYGDLKILIDSPSVNNIYFFTGRQLDSETGLFYFRARYYDAKLGQFISRDPIGYFDGMNLYRGYFAINKLDPRGLFDIWNNPVMDFLGDTQVRVEMLAEEAKKKAAAAANKAANAAQNTANAVAGLISNTASSASNAISNFSSDVGSFVSEIVGQSVVGWSFNYQADYGAGTTGGIEFVFFAATCDLVMFQYQGIVGTIGTPSVSANTGPIIGTNFNNPEEYAGNSVSVAAEGASVAGLGAGATVSGNAAFDGTSDTDGITFNPHASLSTPDFGITVTWSNYQEVGRINLCGGSSDSSEQINLPVKTGIMGGFYLPSFRPTVNCD